MFAYKKVFGTTVLSLMSFSAFAAGNCEPVPSCEAIGFAYTAEQCGTLKKLKCPFDSAHYFCSKSDCNQVTYNETTQYCTKKCADTPTMCIEAAYKTCNTTSGTGLFASNNGVGTLHTANSTISSSSINYMSGNHYLLGPATFSSSAYMQNVHIYNAGREYPNNCSSSMNGTPSLSGSSVTISGSGNIFDVDVTFSSVPYAFGDSSRTWSATFHGDTAIKVQFIPEVFSSYAVPTMAGFQFIGLDKRTTNKLCIELTSSSSASFDGNRKLNVTMSANNADVVYDVRNGTSSNSIINCIPVNGGSCTKDSNACYF